MMRVRDVNLDRSDPISDTQRSANSRNLQRLGALSGAAAVLLMIILVIAGVPAFESNIDFLGPAQEFGEAVTAGRRVLGLANFVIAFNGVLIFWFTGALRAALRRAEGGESLLSSAAYSAGILWAFMWILYAALASSAIELTDYYQNPEGAKTSLALAFHMVLSPITLLLPAVFLGATALITWRNRVFPRWLSGISGLFALLNLAASALGSVFGAPAVILAILTPLWVAATSIMLLKTPRRHVDVDAG